MIHWTFILIALLVGFFLGIFMVALLRASESYSDDDLPAAKLYRDKHGNLIRDDGRHIQQYDPESGEWKTLN